jgi:hypothetical protein
MDAMKQLAWKIEMGMKQISEEKEIRTELFSFHPYFQLLKFSLIKKMASLPVVDAPVVVKKPKTAYQFFQADVVKTVKEELSAVDSNNANNMGAVMSAVSARWKRRWLKDIV